MLQNIVAYVNHYFAHYKRDDINPNFIRFCLVYQFLLAHYLNKNATLGYIMLIFDDYKNAFPMGGLLPPQTPLPLGIKTRLFGREIAAVHQIFSWAFNEIWNKYEKGRGKVYVFDSPFKQCSFLGNLTGLIYWSANVNKIINEGCI